MTHEQRLPYLQSYILQLSQLTYRDPEEILLSGLFFTDFVNTVSLKFEDGSKMKLKSAFFVEDEDSIGVFTEHCGYYIFHKGSLVAYKQKSNSKRNKKFEDSDE